MPLPRMILASGSPHRQVLLREAGYTFDVVEPSPLAERCDGNLPVGSLKQWTGAGAAVVELAYRKAANVVPRFKQAIIVAGDTLVECSGKIFGKPSDAANARQMLQALSGNTHRVWTGLCVWPVPEGPPLLRAAESCLRMDRLAPEQFDQYIRSRKWQGKAGAFGYQDRLGWVHLISGSESNVVGLPLELLSSMLTELENGNQ